MSELVYLVGALAIALIVGSIAADAIRLVDYHNHSTWHTVPPVPMGAGWYALGMVALLTLWVAVATLLP